MVSRDTEVLFLLDRDVWTPLQTVYPEAFSVAYSEQFVHPLEFLGYFT